MCVAEGWEERWKETVGEKEEEEEAAAQSLRSRASGANLSSRRGLDV